MQKISHFDEKLENLMKFEKEEELRKKIPIRKAGISQRKLVRREGEIYGQTESATVVAIIANVVIVEIDSPNNSEYLECIVSGKLISPHSSSSLVVVGDKVKIIRSNSIGDNSGLILGRIVEVLQRNTYFSRKAAGKAKREHVIAANCDKMLILCSLADPIYNRRFIDRVILAAKFGGIEPAICVNKIDLFDDISVFEEDFDIYRKIDYKVFFMSALKNNGIDAIFNFINNSVTLLFGPSGVGKSTLLNDFFGEEVQEVAEISERTGKGQHTTSAVRMFRLDGQTRIIDSPGVREFALWNVRKDELALYFDDFIDYMHNCKFTPCTHTHEPDCAVIQAVDTGEIDAERYNSYLNILDTTDEGSF